MHDRLTIFRRDLEDSDKKIHVVGDYKALHDCLHTLQLLCYFPLTSIRQNIVKPEVKTKLEVKTQLKLCKMDFSSVKRELGEVFKQQRLLRTDFFWVESIEKVWELLNEVSVDDKPDTVERAVINLDEAIINLDFVLRTQPSNINFNLNRSIKDLNLSSLYITLQNVYRVLQELGAKENQLRFFKNGIDHLIKLDNELNKQIHEHTLWQNLDANLQLMDDRIRSGIKLDIKTICKILDDGVLTICNENVEEEWSKRLRLFSEMLNEAIDTGDNDYIADYFSKYKTEARQRFYAVDKNLRILCEQIRPIGDTIRTVLDTINQYEPNSNP